MFNPANRGAINPSRIQLKNPAYEKKSLPLGEPVIFSAESANPCSCTARAGKRIPLYELESRVYPFEKQIGQTLVSLPAPKPPIFPN